MIKTINAWAFSTQRTIPEMFDLARESGFEAVELVVGETGPLPLSVSQAECERISALAVDRGLLLSSLASGLGWSYPITSPNAATRAKGIDFTIQSMQIARWLGVDAILVVPGGVSADFIPNFEGAPYDVAYENAFASLKQLAPHAERLGVTIGVENVWNQFLLSPLEFRSMLDSIESPNVGAYFDVGNVLLTGSPDQWIRILDKRITRVHFKDFKRSTGTLDGFCDLLDGDVDYPSVISALKGTGYDGFVTAEFFDCEAKLRQISAAMDQILER